MVVVIAAAVVVTDVVVVTFVVFIVIVVVVTVVVVIILVAIFLVMLRNLGESGSDLANLMTLFNPSHVFVCTAFSFLFSFFLFRGGQWTGSVFVGEYGSGALVGNNQFCRHRGKKMNNNRNKRNKNKYS